MDKTEALTNIKKIWDNDQIPLGDKMSNASNIFLTNNLQLIETADFIKATPSELAAFLKLGEKDKRITELISKTNPSKTTWFLLANANDKEIIQSLRGLDIFNYYKYASDYIPSQFIYKQMKNAGRKAIASEDKELEASDIYCVIEKGKAFNVLTESDIEFLTKKWIKKLGNHKFTEKELERLIEILSDLADQQVFTRESLDNDQEISDRILAFIGR